MQFTPTPILLFAIFPAIFAQRYDRCSFKNQDGSIIKGKTGCCTEYNYDKCFRVDPKNPTHCYEYFTWNRVCCPDTELSTTLRNNAIWNYIPLNNGTACRTWKQGFSIDGLPDGAKAFESPMRKIR